MSNAIIRYKIIGERTNNSTIKAQNSNVVANYCRGSLYKNDLLVQEKAYLLMLNRANDITGYALISQGAIDYCPVDIRLVCRYCIESLCTSVILVHNHPSGNLRESNEDKKLCKAVESALSVFNIRLLDFLILSDVGEFSFNENMLLN